MGEEVSCDVCCDLGGYPIHNRFGAEVYTIKCPECGSGADTAAPTAKAEESAVYPVPAGWRLVPETANDGWWHNLANQRQGRSSTPRCEAPSEYELRMCREIINEVLAAAPKPAEARSPQPLSPDERHELECLRHQVGQLEYPCSPHCEGYLRELAMRNGGHRP